MDFFKTVFSADPDPSDPENEEDDEEREEVEEAASPENPNPNPSSPSLNRDGGGGGGAWSFGGLIKTIASRSETVIGTYRRDLEEFSSGLKKETSVFKEVASRAVRDLPGSLEIGASVAQESLESVGQAIDDFGGSVWRGTAEIISHGKEALLAVDSDSSVDQNSMEGNSQGFNSSRRYTRFEAQILAIQNDANTFIEEPEDGEDFEKWRSGFEMDEKEEEIEGLLYDNGTLEGFFEKIVPDVVDWETFWARYFYRVYRLKQAEDARAKLVKRVIAGEEEEELSWEVDDSDESEGEVKEEKKEEGEQVTEKGIVGTSESNEEKPMEETEREEIVETSEKPKEEAKGEIVETLDKTKEEVIEKEVVETPKSIAEKKPAETSQVENVEEVENVKSQGDDDLTLNTEDKVPSEPKSEPGESSKDSDFSVISSQPSMQEEEDLEWDEIEDLGEHEDKDKKLGGSNGSPKKVDLRKRLSAPEDDEDLSWDIEDDD